MRPAGPTFAGFFEFGSPAPFRYVVGFAVEFQVFFRFVFSRSCHFGGPSSSFQGLTMSLGFEPFEK